MSDTRAGLGGGEEGAERQGIRALFFAASANTGWARAEKAGQEAAPGALFPPHCGAQQRLEAGGAPIQRGIVHGRAPDVVRDRPRLVDEHPCRAPTLHLLISVAVSAEPTLHRADVLRAFRVLHQGKQRHAGGGVPRGEVPRRAPAAARDARAGALARQEERGDGGAAAAAGDRKG